MAEKKVDTLTAGRDKNLEIAISQIEKQFGKGSIMRMGDSKTALGDVPVVSTGSLGLDIALGIGGLPAGRIVEIYGPESSGKTTLCLHVIANAQAKGGNSLLQAVDVLAHGGLGSAEQVTEMGQRQNPVRGIGQNLHQGAHALIAADLFHSGSLLYIVSQPCYHITHHRILEVFSQIIVRLFSKNFQIFFKN